MASKDEREFDSGLTGGTDVPALEEDFSLEEILAEYGASRDHTINPFLLAIIVYAICTKKTILCTNI